MKRVVKLNGGSRFTLARELDGVGDGGHYLASVNPKTGKHYPNEVRVGCRIHCGSFYARSYQFQDYWNTSPVKTILKVSKDKKTVKFRTLNSVYVLRSE